MKPSIKIAIFIISLLITATISNAQTPEKIDYANKIDSLEKRLNELEKRQSTWEKVVKYLPHLSGYLQTGLNYNSYGEGLTSFQIKRLRLILDGEITSRATYKIQLEAFSGVNVGQRWEKQRIVQFLDAFANYRFFDALQLRAGQFSTPAGYENYLVSPLTNVTIDYASICSRMVLRNALGYNYSDFGRDLGVMIWGEFAPSADGSFKHFAYNLAITNGHLPAVNDNNKSKDIIGALTFYPIKELNLKVAYNWGEYTPDTFSGDITDSHPWSDFIGDKYVPMHRFIAGGWYNNPSGWYIRSEYGLMKGSKRGIQLVDEQGFYFLVAYNFPKWIPVARFDYYRDRVNPSLAENRERGLLGCTWIPNKHIKVQLNYLLSHYTKAASIANKGRNYSSELLLMGLFSF